MVFFSYFSMFSAIFFSATENSSWRIVYEVFKAGSGSAPKNRWIGLKKCFADPQHLLIAGVVHLKLAPGLLPIFGGSNIIANASTLSQIYF